MAQEQPLRVAHVGGYARESASGPENAIVGILKHLPAHGVDVELWQFVAGIDEIARREEDGITIVDLPKREKLQNFLIGLPKQTKSYLKGSAAHIDLVHLHSVFIAENARAGPLLPVPYVISPRGGYGKRVLEGRNRLAKKIWLAAFERRYLESARVLHAVSENEASELERLVPRDRVILVPNGMDKRILGRPIQKPSGQTLVFLGRLAIQHKGIDLLLEGFSRFLRSGKDGASTLILAGPDFRGDKQLIEEQIRALKLEERVSLPGGVFGDAKWDLLEHSYAFVLTSRWEGMPFALLEALAVGRPALVTPGTNMAEVVGEYEAGILVDGDPESIASGLERLMSLPQDEYVRMGRKARSLVEERFTWDRVAGELAARYREIVATQHR